MVFLLALTSTCTLAWSSASRADAFTPTASLHQARFGHTATLLPSGKVLVVGGATANDILGNAELYNPLTNSWATTGSLAHVRTYHTATLLPSGKVLVVGGVNGPNPLATAELYDPATGVWTTAGSLTTARVHHSANLLQSGNVMVAFGTSGANGATKLRSTEQYNPATNSWVASPSAPHERAYHAAILQPNGWLLSFGGIDVDAAPLTDGVVFIPANNGFAGPVGQLATARFAFTSNLLASSAKVLAIGGLGASSTALATAESYDIAGNYWTSAGTMATTRWSHTATELGNGKVLVVAGVDAAGAALASAEFYDPAADVWSAAPSLATARAQHTATLLPTGKVLIVGGQGAAPGYAELASCEVFAVDPIYKNGFD